MVNRFTEMLAKIYYPDEQPIQYTVTLDAITSHEAALDRIFRMCNAVDGTELVCKLKVRSMSVGDIVELTDRIYGGTQVYVCDCVGWANLSNDPEWVEAWKKLPFRDRCFGIEGCVGFKVIREPRDMNRNSFLV